ncbi:hypothetical protein GS399_01770 [Pedobacter sp. HMF7647]|uniref:Uncharacterized protein n=1 Tax=Hufsiella arboris TaxID=2695275 RepID=A0A7K1Y526_9SPHI|nr:hypothetical protein [Hufsiella arboris]MXV49684.1 hypothetical protein [Hufsiella arboris]
MQTDYDSEFKLRVFFFKGEQLKSLSFWENIVKTIEPLTAKAGSDSAVHPSVYDKQRKDWIEFKSLQWNNDDLKKWAGKEQSSDNFQFENVEAFFPGPSKFKASKSTPDMVIKAYIKSSGDETRYDGLFAVFLKDKFIQTLDAETLSQVMVKLYDLLNPVFVAGATKPWAPRESEARYGESLQYLFPSAILENTNEFVFRKGYEEWSQLSKESLV